MVSRLALDRFRVLQPQTAPVLQEHLVDATIPYLFTLDSLLHFVGAYSTGLSDYHGWAEEEIHWIQRDLQTPAGLSESQEWPLVDWLQRRIGEHQAADRAYWRPIIQQLRASNSLMPEGLPV